MVKIESCDNKEEEDKIVHSSKKKHVKDKKNQFEILVKQLLKQHEKDKLNEKDLSFLKSGLLVLCFIFLAIFPHIITFLLVLIAIYKIYKMEKSVMKPFGISIVSNIIFVTASCILILMITIFPVVLFIIAMGGGTSPGTDETVYLIFFCYLAVMFVLLFIIVFIISHKFFEKKLIKIIFSIIISVFLMFILYCFLIILVAKF